PGETMDHFKDTLDLISEIKPDVLNISRYWKRPGTPAARMKQLPPRVIKERSRQMTELFNKHAMDRNVDWLNWRGEVFISEKGSIDKSWKGRNFAYKPIVVLSEENLIGHTVNVKIIDIGKHDLKGKLI
ncbi:2-methylthioadenine synthetase, partial [Candidatus Woesearchaeota archaeon]|nr:2-methylthioadenine synthetase [Candidatus Woesearchaeota archaeon]